MPDLYCQFGAGSPEPFATVLPLARVNDTGIRAGSPATLKNIAPMTPLLSTGATSFVFASVIWRKPAPMLSNCAEKPKMPLFPTTLN
jgi:hypothetical protein